MSTNQRLQEVQSALEQRGVRDVKFFFKLEANAMPASEVKNSVTGVLEQYLAGKCAPMGKLGDSNISN